MNPCPCGWKGSLTQHCSCTPNQTSKYLQKISGPLLDRIDLQINLSPISSHLLTQAAQNPPETSAIIAKRVNDARQCQINRQGKLNAELSQEEILKFCQLEKSDQQQLETTLQHLNGSARTYFRLLKVARTITDLEKNHQVTWIHLIEAISFKRAITNF